MNQETEIIAPSKNVFQDIGTLQNCSFKKYISEHQYTSKLFPQKIYFRTWVLKDSKYTKKNAKDVKKEKKLNQYAILLVLKIVN